MKKIIPVILVFFMLTPSLAACGGKGGAPAATVAPETVFSTETVRQTETALKTEAPTVADSERAETEMRRETLITDEPTAEPQAETRTEPETTAASETAPQTEALTEPVVEFDPRAAAFQCIGESVAVLYERIGYPNDSLYAPSCMGDGDDGELYYSWFTVVTYREGGVETVVDVY